MIHRYNFISKNGCKTIWAQCDADAVTKFKKKHPGESSLSSDKELSIWTITTPDGYWVLNVPASKKGTNRVIKKAMKRIEKRKIAM